MRTGFGWAQLGAGCVAEEVGSFWKEPHDDRLAEPPVIGLEVFLTHVDKPLVYTGCESVVWRCGK